MLKLVQFKTGLIIGRFQPFHLGHQYLLEEALKQCEQVVVGIGSANITDEDNPYSYDLRKRMVEAFLQTEKVEERVSRIFPSMDIPSDDLWLQKTIEQSGPFDVVIGNNDWVNGIFRNAGYRILEIAHYKRFLYEGYKIRRLMRMGKNWQHRVPKYIVPFLQLR